MSKVTFIISLWVSASFKVKLILTNLTYYCLVFPIYTPWKHQKIYGKKGTPDGNGLNINFSRNQKNSWLGQIKNLISELGVSLMLLALFCLFSSFLICINDSCYKKQIPIFHSISLGRIKNLKECTFLVLGLSVTAFFREKYAFLPTK